MRNIFTLFFAMLVMSVFCSGRWYSALHHQTITEWKNPGKYHPNEQLHCFSATNFIINLPSNTTISNPTFFYNITAVPGGGATEYGHVVFQTVNWVAGNEYPLMTFSWTTTNAPGTTGNFTILNDFTNYVELDNFDRSGPPVNQANAIPLPSNFLILQLTDLQMKGLQILSGSLHLKSMLPLRS